MPGAMPTKLPGDLAMALPKGSDIVMQTHFHPSGKRETEQAEMALYFADRPPSKQLVPIQVPAMFGFGANIDIPAGEKNFASQTPSRCRSNVQAISVGGHAALHLPRDEDDRTHADRDGKSMSHANRRLGFGLAGPIPVRRAG